MIKWIHERLEDRDSEGGFTLIELLVVVIIIGILAAIAIPVFLNQRERGWIASMESDLRNAAIEMETEYTSSNPSAYPTTLPTDVQESEGVNLSVFSGGQTFCLDATHDNLPGEERSYDSAAGGLQDGACS